MSDAKKIMVGSTWKAKEKSRGFPRPGPPSRGLPKTNCAPSPANPNRKTKNLLMALNTSRPASSSDDEKRKKQIASQSQ